MISNHTYKEWIVINGIRYEACIELIETDRTITCTLTPEEHEPINEGITMIFKKADFRDFLYMLEQAGMNLRDWI